MDKKLAHPVSLSVYVIFLLSLQTAPAAAQTAGGEYAGTETCQDCHESRYEDFKASIHGNTADKRTPAAHEGCESCHGPRAQHVKDMERKRKVPDDDTLQAAVDHKLCLNCHNKSRMVLWPGSVHERHDLTCSDCHRVHGSNANLLAASTQTEICSTCHKDVRAQLLRQSHHPIREGKMTCSDCHNPHGTISESLIAANTVNEKCWECHAEYRGPFLWEHAPVTENCMNCHTAHGSNHSPLLESRTPFLCQGCHSNSRHPGTLYAQPAGANVSVYQNMNNRLFYRNCQNCHSAVHGSNHPSGKSLAR